MFSVIIPLYNKADYLAKCLNSALNQTFRGFEIIIVDDGSTDNSLEIVNNYLSGKSSNTKPHQHNLPLGGWKIIHQKNSGVSTARNNGVKAAKYDYIAFLDADDWWDLMFLEEMKELINTCPDAALCGCNYFYVKNGKNRLEDKGLPKDFSKGYIDYIGTYCSNFVVPINCSFVTIKKNGFEAIGGFKHNLKFGEDFDLWIRIALKYKVAYNNLPLSYSNQNIVRTHRALGQEKHWQPHEHYIFNMDYLNEEEAKNPNLKKLLDGLRVRSLLRYYLNGWNKTEVNHILSKVNFSRQPAYFRRIYHWPYPLIKCWFSIKAIGSYIKQKIIRTFLKYNPLTLL